MTKSIKEQTEELKMELEGKIDALNDRSNLLPDGSDRTPHLDLWTLSVKELEALIGQSLTVLNDSTSVAPQSAAISSHRGLIGIPIVALKKLIFGIIRPFTDTLLADQEEFNARVVQMQLAQYVLQSRLKEEIADVVSRIQSLEEDSAILHERVLRDDQSE